VDFTTGRENGGYLRIPLTQYEGWLTYRASPPPGSKIQAKKHDRKLTSHQLLKEFVSITYTSGRMPNGERFATVVNVTGEHMNLIRRLGLARGSYRKLADDFT